MNLFQVLNSDDLDEIILTNPNKMVICMFSSKNCPPCVKIKPTFIEYSKTYTNSLFVYVDVMFEDKKGKYLSHVEVTPMFLFFFNASMIANMKGSDENLLEQIIIDLSDKIEDEFKKIKEERRNKISVLRQLADIESSGVELSEGKVFNIEYSLEELQHELNIHLEKSSKEPHVEELEGSHNINNNSQPMNQSINKPMDQPMNQSINKLTNQSINQSTNTIRSEKIERIQELNRLSKLKQREQLNKLQQLKKLHKKKLHDE